MPLLDRLRSSNALRSKKKQRGHSISEDSSEVLPQTEEAVIVPRDENCSRARRIPDTMFSKRKFKGINCPDAKATLESFLTHAHHAER